MNKRDKKQLRKDVKAAMKLDENYIPRYAQNLKEGLGEECDTVFSLGIPQFHASITLTCGKMFAFDFGTMETFLNYLRGNRILLYNEYEKIDNIIIHHAYKMMVIKDQWVPGEKPPILYIREGQLTTYSPKTYDITKGKQISFQGFEFQLKKFWSWACVSEARNLLLVQRFWKYDAWRQLTGQTMVSIKKEFYQDPEMILALIAALPLAHAQSNNMAHLKAWAEEEYAHEAPKRAAAAEYEARRAVEREQEHLKMKALEEEEDRDNMAHLVLYFKV